MRAKTRGERLETRDLRPDRHGVVPAPKMETRDPTSGTGSCRLQRWRPDALVGWLLILLSLTLSCHAAEPSARSSFQSGVKAFVSSNYPEANEAFLSAADTAEEEKLDPAIAHYDAALAASAAGDLTSAADLFARAATSTDLKLQAKAFYNRGNTLFQQAGGPSTGMPTTMPMPAPELKAAGDSIGEAIQMYENAIALDPQDTDAKVNYELAVLKQQEIQQQQQQQDQQKKNQDKKDQNQDKQKQNQPQQNQDQPQQDQDQPQQDQQEQQEKEPPQSSASKPNENPSGKEQPIEEEKPSEKMTPEEAAMMLDAMKAQEQSQRDQLHPFLGRPIPVEKDW